MGHPDGAPGWGTRMGSPDRMKVVLFRISNAYEEAIPPEESFFPTIEYVSSRKTAFGL